MDIMKSIALGILIMLKQTSILNLQKANNFIMNLTIIQIILDHTVQLVGPKMIKQF